MDADPVIRPIFLSASEPSPERDEGYWINRRLLNVREAVRALCAHAMLHYPIVFGGHPAITPLVLQIAERVAHEEEAAAAREKRKPRRPQVVMFQSRRFVDGEDSGSVVFTPILNDEGKPTSAKDERTRRLSLLQMRYEMLGGPKSEPTAPMLDRAELGQRRYARLRTHDFTAAVFIGGMEGVESEFNIFRDFHPDTPAYPIASTGSASQKLLGKVSGHLSDDIKDKLAEEPAYTLLMQEILPLPSGQPQVSRLLAPAPAPHWQPGRHDNPNDWRTHIDPEKPSYSRG